MQTKSLYTTFFVLFRIMFTSATVFLFFSLSFCRGATQQSLVTRNIHYSHNKQPMEGYLAFDQKNPKKRPGVLLIHEWTGLGDYIKKRARMLATLGYTAFAMDMYGKGIRAKNHEEAGKLMQKYVNDPKLMLARIKVALNLLKGNPLVDSSKIAVIGYCFGGGAAIQFALSGEPLSALVSFHGALKPPTAEDIKKIRTKLLIHHGANDTFVSQEVVQKFKEAFFKAHVDLNFITHENAVHGFTRWSAGDDTLSGVAYDETADLASWKSMLSFFNETFQK